MSTRYAIYIVPYHEDLFLQASRWLGWDCVAVGALLPPSEEEVANPTGLDIGIERGFEVRGTWLHGQVRGSRAAKLRALSPTKVSFGQLIVNSKPLILGLLLRFASTIM
jgi:hypothetical protein